MRKTVFSLNKLEASPDIGRKVIGLFLRKVVGGIFKTANLASSDTNSGKLFVEKLSAGSPKRHALCLTENFSGVSLKDFLFLMSFGR